MAERPIFVSEEMASSGGCCGGAIGLEPAGAFSWRLPPPPCGNEAGQRRSGLLAREKELNVGHFLRLSVAQCGGSGQERVWGARCGGSEPLRSGA